MIVFRFESSSRSNSWISFFWYAYARRAERQRVLCGTYSRRTQRKDLLLLASLRATQPIGPMLEPIDTAHRSVTSCDNTWWLTLVETAMESTHTIGTGRYGGTAYYGVLKGHRGVL
jgi:hypothetical protein